MNLHEAALRRVTESLAFRASAAAYLVMDGDLCIRAANHAYEEATLHNSAEMIGEFMFDVFPDNPDTPQARSVQHLERSLEWVLRHGGQNRMALQRYDVRDPATGRFVSKTWLPVNTPIFDPDGHAIAILHHVEDVSHLVLATSLEHLLSLPAAEAAPAEVEAAARRRREADVLQQRGEAMMTRTVQAAERANRRITASQSRLQRGNPQSVIPRQRCEPHSGP